MSDSDDETYSDHQFTSSSPGRQWPANFADWPEPERRHYVTRYLKRRDLIRRVLLLSGYEPGTIEESYKLRKDELAAIFLTLRDSTREVAR